MRICVRACCALQGRVGVCIQRIQAGVRREDGEEGSPRRTRTRMVDTAATPTARYAFKQAPMACTLTNEPDTLGFAAGNMPIH